MTDDFSNNINTTGSISIGGSTTGNIEVSGDQDWFAITLNNGNEYVRLSGMIRPQDISANNVVQSSRIANAKIAYLGVGDIADTGQKGWLSRALSSISPL